MNELLQETEASAEVVDSRLSVSEGVQIPSEESSCELEWQPGYADVATLVQIAEADAHHSSRLAGVATALAIPTIGYVALAVIFNHDLLWLPALLTGAFSVPALLWQAIRLGDHQTALDNSHLGRRWIGPLCEALQSPDSRVRRVATLLLEQFLPRLTEADLGLLTEEQLTCLYRRLTIPASIRNPELVIAILKALPSIGGEPALLLVERLAAYPPVFPHARRIREAARATQKVLEHRILPDHAPLEKSVNEFEMPAPELTESEQQAHDEMAAYVDGQIRKFEEAREKLQNPGMRLQFLIASYLIIVPYVAWLACQAFFAGQWISAMLLSLTALAGTQLHRLTMMPQHHAIAEALAELDDVRCIGRLAEMLEWPDVDVQEMAKAALTRLLPRVKATDRVFTAPRQRENLRRLLNHTHSAQSDTDFVISLLQALEQIGDADDLPYVRLQASAQPVWGLTIPYTRADAARHLRVRDAARQCLPYLEKRAELGKISQTLLRASSATSTGSDMLVRAADAGAASDPAQLLRAEGSLDDPASSVISAPNAQ